MSTFPEGCFEARIAMDATHSIGSATADPTTLQDSVSLGERHPEGFASGGKSNILIVYAAPNDPIGSLNAAVVHTGFTQVNPAPES